MRSEFLAGAAGKFAESLGSGLAYGVVAIIGVAILKFWILTDTPIVEFTDYTKTCTADAGGSNCIVGANCPSDSVAIGGECTIHASRAEIHIQNFGLYGTSAANPTRFECNWSGPGAQPGQGLVPYVRAACVKKSTFGPLPNLTR
jgi:hypothetical protein